MHAKTLSPGAKASNASRLRTRRRRCSLIAYSCAPYLFLNLTGSRGSTARYLKTCKRHTCVEVLLINQQPLAKFTNGSAARRVHANHERFVVHEIRLKPIPQLRISLRKHKGKPTSSEGRTKRRYKKPQQRGYGDLRQSTKDTI